MLKRLTYQKKVRLLPWGTAIVFLLLYFLAFSETLTIRKQGIQMEKEAVTMEKAPSEMIELQKRLDEINKIAGDKAVNSGIDPLMELISNLSSSYRVTLSDYQPAHIFQYQNYTVQTRVISFEAPFIPCLKVLNNLEKNYHFGKVVSVNYIAKTNNKISKKQLIMQVLIQSIHNENNLLSEN